MAKKKNSTRNFLAITAILMIVALFVYKKWQSQNVYSGELNLKELPQGFRSYGLDISHHQGPIDWTVTWETCDSIIGFVYCKATEGINHVDSQWKRNREQLSELKVPHGAYHFFLPQKDANTQAQHFLNNYKPQEGDLPPVLDAETEGKSDADLISRMKTWLTKVEQDTGRRPIIYTSHHFYRTKFKGHFEGYKFWIANYNARVSGMDDEQIIHWQYSDKGKVPGIAGNVDLNFSKIIF